METFRVMTYYDVTSFDKLKPGLPKYNVGDIHYITENVEKNPVGIQSFIMVRKRQPGRTEPQVVVERHCH